MNKHDVDSWKTDPITRKLSSLIKEAIQLNTEDIMRISAENEDSFFKKYYFLRGQVEALNMVLEAELFETEEKESGVDQT